MSDSCIVYLDDDACEVLLVTEAGVRAFDPRMAQSRDLLYRELSSAMATLYAHNLPHNLPSADALARTLREHGFTERQIDGDDAVKLLARALLKVARAAES